MNIIACFRSSLFSHEAATLASLPLLPAPHFQEHCSVGHFRAGWELLEWDDFWFLASGVKTSVMLDSVKRIKCVFDEKWEEEHSCS